MSQNYNPLPTICPTTTAQPVSAISCCLVLDVLNASDPELEPEYASGKRLTMEAAETCRVPVDRCPPRDEVRRAGEDETRGRAGR